MTCAQGPSGVPPTIARAGQWVQAARSAKILCYYAGVDCTASTRKHLEEAYKKKVGSKTARLPSRRSV
jgi:hypothetical protein